MTEQELVKKALDLWRTHPNQSFVGSIHIGTNDIGQSDKTSTSIRLDFAEDGRISICEFSGDASQLLGVWQQVVAARGA